MLLVTDGLHTVLSTILCILLSNPFANGYHYPLQLASANQAAYCIGTNNLVWRDEQIRAFCQEGLYKEIAWFQNLHVQPAIIR